MSKAAIVGDWHGDIHFARRVLNVLKEQGITNIYHTGDWGFLWNPNEMGDLVKLQNLLHHNGQTLYWVDGNHENFTLLNSFPIVDGVRPMMDNLIHMPRGYRKEIDGHTWLFLGGATSLDRPGRREGISWWPEEELTLSDLYRASEGGLVDVMVTHDCPSRVEIPGLHGHWPVEELERAEIHRSMLGSVVDEVRPHVLFHGHFHTRYSWHRINRNHGVTLIEGLDCNQGSIADNIIVIDTETLAYGNFTT